MYALALSAVVQLVPEFVVIRNDPTSEKSASWKLGGIAIGLIGGLLFIAASIDFVIRALL